MSAVVSSLVPGKIKAALAHHQRGELDAAAQIYDEILSQEPLADALHLKGLIEHHRGQSAAAIPLMLQALDQEPRSAIIHNNLGAAYLATGNLQAAESHFRQACAHSREPFASAWSNLTTILLQQNRCGEAMVIAQRGLELSPDQPELWHQLGIARERSGQWAQAEGAYQKSLELQPDQPKVYNDLGSVLGKLERHPEAAAAFQQACEKDPDFAAAWSNLGAMLQKIQRHQEAAAALQRALQLQPRFAGAHFNYARLLSELGKTEKALFHFQQAVERKPDHVDFLMGLAAACNSLGRFEEAVEAYRKIITLVPRHAHAYYSLLTFNSQFVTAEEIQKLEQLLADNLFTGEEHTGACFGLGKWYDEQGEFAKAFRCYHQGNERSARRTQFDVTKLRELVNDLTTVFTPKFFDQYPHSGSDTTQPVFILGMPRSGSTLVDQILTCHSQIRGAGEFDGMRKLLSQQLAGMFREETDKKSGRNYPHCIPHLTSRQLRQLADFYLQRLVQSTGPATYITDKLPSNAFHIGLISLLFPGATIIYTQRDRLDIGLSCYFQNFSTGHEFSYDLRNIARFLHEHERLMQHWQAVCPTQIHIVEYEKLVENQEQETRRLIEEICRLPWEDDCLEFQNNRRAVQTASLSQVRKPIYSRSVQKWKQYAEFLGPLVEELERLDEEDRH